MSISARNALDAFVALLGKDNVVTGDADLQQYRLSLIHI